VSKIRSVRQCTDAPRQDEGPSAGAALLAVAVLGLATDAVALALPRQQAGCCPPGWPPPAGSTSDLRWPTAVGPPCSCRPASCSGFTALAVQRDSPGLLGAAWLAHVTWDALRHRGRGPTRVRSWYPPLCIGYDVAVAAPLLTGQL
jgi:hypothetical protein